MKEKGREAEERAEPAPQCFPPLISLISLIKRISRCHWETTRAWSTRTHPLSLGQTLPRSDMPFAQGLRNFGLTSGHGGSESYQGAADEDKVNLNISLISNKLKDNNIYL